MTPRDALIILLRSGTGRLGALFLTTLVLASIFVLLRFPLDFGSSRWNNPLEWSDNPKAVPPAWTSIFQGDDAVPHTVFLASEPDSTAAAGATTARIGGEGNCADAYSSRPDIIHSEAAVDPKEDSIPDLSIASSETARRNCRVSC